MTSKRTINQLYTFFVLMLVGSLYFHANIGGSGFRIPNNILVWLFASLIACWGLYHAAKNRSIVLPQYFIYVAAFPILALFSGIVAGVAIPTDWFLRLFFIWGGLLFLFALFQFNLSQRQIDQILFFTVIASLFHALIGTTQIFLGVDVPGWLPVNPSSMPTGTFQQINNQASFQVTAMLLAFWLMTRPGVRYGKNWQCWVLIISVAFNSFIISFSGSRVAILGLLMALPLLLISRWHFIRQDKSRWLLIIMMMAVVTTAANSLEHNRGLDLVAEKAVAANAGYSGEARLGIYSITFDLIKQQPVFGHGIGSFVEAWQLAKPDFYVQHPEATLPNQRVSHPHNELIFWLVEGGIMAGIGLLSVLIGTLIALAQLPYRRRYAYAALLLPIALHTQVELPFYISSLHWFVFLFLLFLLFRPLARTHINVLSTAANKLVKLVAATGLITSSLFLSHTMAANLEFRDYIQQKADPVEPFETAMQNPYFKSLATHITMTLLFERSRQYGLEKNLALYAEWIEQELVHNPHSNYFKLAIRARLSLNEDKKSCQLTKKAQAIYPDDKTFNEILSQCNDLLIDD